MPCIIEPQRDGSLLFFCGERLNEVRCCACSEWATASCDWRLDLPKQRTCDALLCAVHALHVGDETDYCPAHAYQLLKRQR